MQSRCSRLHREHGGSEGAFTSPKSHFALRSLQCTCIEISVSDGPVPEGPVKLQSWPMTDGLHKLCIPSLAHRLVSCAWAPYFLPCRLACLLPADLEARTCHAHFQQLKAAAPMSQVALEPFRPVAEKVATAGEQARPWPRVICSKATKDGPSRARDAAHARPRGQQARRSR